MKRSGLSNFHVNFNLWKIGVIQMFHKFSCKNHKINNFMDFYFQVILNQIKFLHNLLNNNLQINFLWKYRLILLSKIFNQLCNLRKSLKFNRNFYFKIYLSIKQNSYNLILLNIIFFYFIFISKDRKFRQNLFIQYQIFHFLLINFLHYLRLLNNTKCRHLLLY